jgi:hypothetical protein
VAPNAAEAAGQSEASDGGGGDGGDGEMSSCRWNGNAARRLETESSQLRAIPLSCRTPLHEPGRCDWPESLVSQPGPEWSGAPLQRIVNTSGLSCGQSAAPAATATRP